MDLSIIIVNYKTDELTADCISSVKKNTRRIKYEIVVIDNSTNNIGFAAGNNVGIKKSKGRYILLLNSDTLISSNVLEEMVDYMDENSKIGIATCALRNKDGSIQGTGGYFPTLIRVFSWMTIQDLPLVEKLFKQFHPHTGYDKYQELDWVTGAFMLIRRKVIEDIGILDDGYFMYTEDTDFCYRAKKAGWKIAYNPKWSITHFGGASSTRSFPIVSEFKGIKRFYKKFYSPWQYPILRFLLKLGSLMRMPFKPTIYAEALRSV